MNEIQTIIVFTGAPRDADYSYVAELETFECPVFPGAKPKAWRKVEITTSPYQIAYQCDRYCSFLGGCVTLDDPREVPLGEGRQAPTNYRG